MKSNKCNHKVSFTGCLLVTNPHNYPCPHCQKRLTLDKTGRRFLWATVAAAGLYASVVGTLSLLATLQGAQMSQLILLNLIGFILGAFFLLPILYLGWKRSRFIERTKLERIRQVTRTKGASKYPSPAGLRRLVPSMSNS